MYRSLKGELSVVEEYEKWKKVFSK
jgi:hypothetical protein